MDFSDMLESWALSPNRDSVEMAPKHKAVFGAISAVSDPSISAAALETALEAANKALGKNEPLRQSLELRGLLASMSHILAVRERVHCLSNRRILMRAE